MLSLPALNRIKLSAFFLGLYFIFLPFDFYRAEDMGSITRLIACLPIGFCILERIKNDKTIKIKLNGITKAGSALLMVMAVSMTVTVSLNTSIGAYMTLLMNMVMVLLLGGTQKYTKEEILWLEKCLIASGWLTAFLMVAFSQFNINRMLFSMGDSKQDPNYMCGFMLYAFCYHINGSLNERKIAHVGVAAVLFILVILSGSRGALLAYLVAVIATVIISKEFRLKRKKRLIKGIVLILIGVLLLHFFVLPKINTAIMERYTLDYLYKYGTIGRVDIWVYLLNKYMNADIITQLIGFGYGTTAIVNDMPSVKGAHVAHNLYIDNLVSAGLAGLFAQLIFQYNCLKTALQVKQTVIICTYFSYLAMCLSLSLTSYKPMWALVIMILLYEGSVDDEA